MFIITLVLSILLAAGFGAAGGSKLAKASQSITQRDQLGVSPQLWTAVGGLEIAGATGLLVGLALAPLGVAAAIGLTLLMIGAIATHIRARDLAHMPPAAVLAVLAAVTAIVRGASA